MRSSLGRGIIWLSLLGFGLAPMQALRAADEAAAKADDSKAASSADVKGAGTKDAAKAEPAKSATADKGQAVAPGHKSPAIAGGLAFLPGVAVHGAGHMYAGSWMKGLGLLAIEGAALGIGIPTAINGADRMQKAFNGVGDGAGLTDAGDSFRDVGIVLVSTMAFLWTWFDDMAGAPIAANEHNRLADEQAAQADLKISPSGDGVSVALVQRF